MEAATTCGDHGGRRKDGEPCTRQTNGRCWSHPEGSPHPEPPPEPQTGKLVTPSHGSGRIWRGRPANPRAGPGRPPSQVREALRLSFSERIPVLENIADGVVEIRLVGKCEECGHVGGPLTQEEVDGVQAQAPKVRDMIRAIEAMAKYSDIQDRGPDEALVQELGEAVAEVVEDSDQLDEIKLRWKRIIGRRLVFGS